jgi:hypothetical protein
MSDELTKDIGQKYATKPTLETLVQMLADMRAEMAAGFSRIEQRFDVIESRLYDVENLADRVSGMVFEIRADVRELKRSTKVADPK